MKASKFSEAPIAVFLQQAHLGRHTTNTRMVTELGTN